MDGEIKRICIILPGKLPVPNIRGGAIETLLTLLVNQNEIFNKVHFIVISPWADGVLEISKKYKNTEFYYFRLRTGPWKKGINLINYIIAKKFGVIDFFKTPMHYDIEKIIKGIDADYVVVEHAVYKHFNFLQRYYQPNQLYLHLHGTGPMPDRKTRETFGNIITVSDFINKFYMKEITDTDTKLYVCLNGVDDAAFSKKISVKKRQKIRESFDVSEKDFLVMYCGRLIPEKGVKELIRAVLDTCNPNIKLMIVGSSNFEGAAKNRYVNELESMIKDNENRIFFTGFVPNNELYSYYQSADIQAVCSTCEEAAGLVVVEGMMSGIPQIITDSGGISEYADPAYSFCVKKYNSIVNPQDSLKLSKELAEKLNDLYVLFQQDSSLFGHPKINTDDFDAKHFYERFINIFIENN